MTDRSVRIRLEAITAQYQQKMQQAAMSTKTLSSSVDTLSSRAHRFGTTATTMGNRMTVGLTLPLAALGYKAVKTAADFDRSMNTMGAVAQIAGEPLARLRRLAIEMGEDTVFSANEAALAMVELTKAGLRPAQIEAGALANTLDLATAGDLEIADAATIAANSMAVFGLSGKETKLAVDALAGAANSSSADVSDLALALSMGGNAAATAGLDIAETTAVLAALADEGIRGSDAGTSLKTMLMALPGASGPARDAIEELGLRFFDAQDRMRPIGEIADELQDKLGGLGDKQRMVALRTIFGTDAFRAANIVMAKGSEGLEKYEEDTRKVGNAHKVAEGKMKGLPGVIEELSGSWETFLLKNGELMTDTVINLSESAQGLLQTFADLEPGTQKFLLQMTAISAAAGPLLRVVGPLSIAASNMSKVKVPAVPVQGGAPVVAGGGSSLLGKAGGVAGLFLAARALDQYMDKAHEAGGRSQELSDGFRRVINASGPLGVGFITINKAIDETPRLLGAVEDRLLGIETHVSNMPEGISILSAGFADYNEVMERARDLTKEERAQIGGLIDRLVNLKGPLDEDAKSTLKLFTYWGEGERALKFLRAELDKAENSHERNRRKVDEHAEGIHSLAERVQHLGVDLGKVGGKAKGAADEVAGLGTQLHNLPGSVDIDIKATGTQAGGFGYSVTGGTSTAAAINAMNAVPGAQSITSGYRPWDAGSYHSIAPPFNAVDIAGSNLESMWATLGRLKPREMILDHMISENGSSGYYAPSDHTGANRHLHFMLEKGGYFDRRTSGFMTVAERSPEIVSPVPVMRQVVREETNIEEAVYRALERAGGMTPIDIHGNNVVGSGGMEELATIVTKQQERRRALMGGRRA